MTLTGAAKLAGVMGWPVSHSLSPRLHGYWLQEYGIDGAYVPLSDVASFRTVGGLMNIAREDGRGLFLMRALMDRVERFTDGGNVVRLVLHRP